MKRLQSDEDFAASLEGFSRDAQEMMWRDRRRDIEQARADVLAGKPVVTRGIADLDGTEDLRAQREALHNGSGTMTSQPKAKDGPSLKREFDELTDSAGKIIGERMNKLAAHIGERFRDEIEKMQKSIDGRFATLRNDYLQGARSRASELARNEVDGRIEAALESHRAERVALVRQVAALRDEVERLRQEYRA